MRKRDSHHMLHPWSALTFLMIRRPPRSTHCISSAASDVYKRQVDIDLGSSAVADIAHFYAKCSIIIQRKKKNEINLTQNSCKLTEKCFSYIHVTKELLNLWFLQSTRANIPQCQFNNPLIYSYIGWFSYYILYDIHRIMVKHTVRFTVYIQKCQYRVRIYIFWWPLHIYSLCKSKQVNCLELQVLLPRNLRVTKIIYIKSIRIYNV